MNFEKFLRTSFLQNTSGGNFYLPNIHHFKKQQSQTKVTKRNYIKTMNIALYNLFFKWVEKQFNRGPGIVDSKVNTMGVDL